MAKRNEAAKDGIERGTGNIFADIGYADAKERQTKLRPALAINQIIEQRKLTQAKAASALGLPQPKVSLLSRYKVEGFSVERLMNFLTLLDQDVEISIKKASSRSNGKIPLLRHEQPQWLTARYWQNPHDLHGFTRKDRVVRMVFEQLGGCFV